MKLFKQKSTNRNSSAFENIQAKVNPVPKAAMASRREVEFEVEIEANMAELVNEDINEIEIVTIPETSIRTKPSSIKDINKTIKEYKKPKTKEAKAMTVDPKELLSHGDLGDISSPMISPKGDKTKLVDNIVEEKINFVERPITNIRPTTAVNVNDLIDNRINFNAGNEPLSTLKALSSPIASPFGNLNTSRPVIKNRKSSTVPKVTRKTIKLRAPIGQVPKVRLKNKTGRKVGEVKNNGRSVKSDSGRQNDIYNYRYFATLAKEKKMFDMSFTSDGKFDYLHITTPYGHMIDRFQVFARTLSRSPELDTTYDLGVLTKGRAKAINLSTLPFDLSKKIMFHAIPIVGDTPICHSHTVINEGIYEESNVSHCSIQYLPNVTRFHINNIPVDAVHVYAIRTNEMSGRQIRLPIVNVNQRTGAKKTTDNKSNIVTLDYDDTNVSDINSVYAYDFFVRNRYGIEKHLFRKTMRTYEKDIMGHVFKRAGMKRNPDGVTSKFNLSLAYPNPFIPKDVNYSLDNPSDDFYEACRNQKRVCTLRIIRHCSNGEVDNLGTYILNPGQLNTLEAEVDKFSNFNVEFDIDAEFLKNAGAPRVLNSSLDYYYEMRMGSYLLANELSFLSNPLKLEVPNEFTDGKVGYNYHPYIYESPSRKDYGLLGTLGVSKKYLYEESLNSSAKIFTQPASGERYKKTKKNRFTAKLSKVSKNDHCVVLRMNIEKRLLQLADHFELFVGDSTTGNYRSLGKNKLVNSEFYYVDVSSSELACNKLKYKLVARSTGLENICSFETDVLDISETNVLRRKDDRSSGVISRVRNRKSRGIK